MAGVSQQVLNRYGAWIARGGISVAGFLPPPVTEWSIVKGSRDRHRIVVAWMGRPLETKGLMSLPYLLALDPRMVVRAWTGAETAGLEYTRRVQTRTLGKCSSSPRSSAWRIGWILRPLDFDPFSYRHRLEGVMSCWETAGRKGF